MARPKSWSVSENRPTVSPWGCTTQPTGSHRRSDRKLNRCSPARAATWAHAMASWPDRTASNCRCEVTLQNTTTAGSRMMSADAESTPPSLKSLYSSPSHWDAFRMKAKHALPKAPAITAPWRSGSPPEHQDPNRPRRKPMPANWKSSPESPPHRLLRNWALWPQTRRF